MRVIDSYHEFAPLPPGPGKEVFHVKRRLCFAAALLLFLILSSCAAEEPFSPALPEESTLTSPAESESAPGEAQTGEDSPLRLTPEGTLLPPADWAGGELYPYPVIIPYRFEGDRPEETREGTYLLYGLADGEGRIVTDPYFLDYEIVTADDGVRFLLLSRCKGSYLAWLKTELYGLTSMMPPETDVMILEKSGRWSTSFGSAARYLGENRLLLEKGTRQELYKTDGSLLREPWDVPLAALSQAGIPYAYYRPFESGTAYSSGFFPVCGLTPPGDDGKYLFNYVDAEGNLLLEKNCPVLAPFDPYGTAAVKDPESGLYGVIDSSGAYLIEPSYEKSLTAVTRDLYSFTGDGVHFGLLRVSTGETVLPAKFWNIPAQPEDPNGFVWVSPETGLYPWSPETGRRVLLPEPLSSLPGSSEKELFYSLSGGWYWFHHGYGTPERAPEYILFRFSDPASYLVYPAEDYFDPRYDEERGKIVLERSEGLGYAAHALFLDPVTGEESEPESYYSPVSDLGDGLYRFDMYPDAGEHVRLFLDAEGNRFFDEDPVFARSAGGGLFACTDGEGSYLCRRDGTRILSLPPAETAPEKAD